VYRRGYYTDPFTDLLFNALLGFTLLFFIAIAMVNPESKRGVIDPKAEFIISATWPDQLPDDIDLWVEDPHGEIVSYLQRDAGWMHLDRDDRGEINDKVVIDGKEVVYPINQEIVTIRGAIPGEYTVNLYYYRAGQTGGVPVTLKVERVNPEFRLVFVDQITLEAEDVEVTAVRFTVTRNRELVGVNRLQRTLTPYQLVPE
jgi:hypothetical protein